MKQINIILIIMIISHAPTLSIAAASTVVTHTAKIASKYIPTMISSNSKTNQPLLNFQSNSVTIKPTFTPSITTLNNKNIFSPTLYTNLNSINTDINKDIASKHPNLTTTTQPINTSKQDKFEDVINTILTTKVTLPENNEYHIATDLLSDQNIESFKQKFSQETDVFINKLSEFWTIIKDAYDTLKNKLDDKTIKSSTLTPPAITPKQPQVINHEKVISDIKNVTEKIFDPNDLKPLSVYLQEMRLLASFLDQDKDKIIIQAIEFLQENQHRTSLWDIPFWQSAIKEKNLKSIPYSRIIHEKPNNTLLYEFMKKVNLKEV